jgi:hypothetical protein
MTMPRTASFPVRFQRPPEYAAHPILSGHRPGRHQHDRCPSHDPLRFAYCAIYTIDEGIAICKRDFVLRPEACVRCLLAAERRSEAFVTAPLHRPRAPGLRSHRPARQRARVRRRPTYPNHVWAENYLRGRRGTGRPPRIAKIVRGSTREHRSVDGAGRRDGNGVLRPQARGVATRHAWRNVRSDNGSEFTAQAVACRGEGPRVFVEAPRMAQTPEMKSAMGCDRGSERVCPPCGTAGHAGKGTPTMGVRGGQRDDYSQPAPGTR